MAIKASAQIDLIDLTDGFTVVLTNENHTFLGTTSAVDGTQTATCQVQALQGENVVNCEVGDVTCPTGLSIVSDGKTPVPTLTITATSALTKSGSVIIPVKIGEITINKTFSWSIAFRVATGHQLQLNRLKSLIKLVQVVLQHLQENGVLRFLLLQLVNIYGLELL